MTLPPPPDWPSADRGGRRASDDDLRNVITELRVDVATFRGETSGRLDQLTTQLTDQVERLEERIQAERHSRKTTDDLVGRVQTQVEKLDEKVDDNRVSLAGLMARLTPPATAGGVIGALLYDLVPKVIS